jgi:hypothetical protein
MRLSAYLEVIWNIIVFASRSTKQAITRAGVLI